MSLSARMASCSCVYGKYIHHDKSVTHDTTAGMFSGPSCHRSPHEYSKISFFVYLSLPSLSIAPVATVLTAATARSDRGSRAMTMATASSNRLCYPANIFMS